MLTIDFESRSRIDLKKCGLYRYAIDPSTEIICLAVKLDDSPAEIWFNPKFEVNLPLMSDQEVKNLINSEQIIEAHNMQFERVMWREILEKRHGFDPLPFHKLRCSAAIVSKHNLPRALGRACSALGLPVQKDDAGHKLMMKMCKPLPIREQKKNKGEWLEDIESMTKLGGYCMTDTDAEYGMSRTLEPLTDEEQRVWQVDQIINDRGIPVDLGAIKAIQDKVSAYSDKIMDEATVITGGIKPTQRDKTISWLKLRGLNMPDMQKETVKSVMACEAFLDDDIVKLLKIKQAVSKSSVAKFSAMERMSINGRVHGTMLYWGAGQTGRFAGRGIQPQNMARKCDVQGPENFRTMEAPDLMAKYGDIFTGASQCVRPVIYAGPGRVFVQRDYSKIEAVKLAWLAGDEDYLELMCQGVDTYKIAAGRCYGIPADNVTKEQRDAGKVVELSAGYQGFTGAFQRMAKTYNVHIGDEKAGPMIMAWRESRPKVRALWDNLNDAAIRTVKTGRPHKFRKITFGMVSSFLCMKLPSGRMIRYYKPTVKLVTDKYKRTKETLIFLGTDDKGKFGRIATYGGKLTENACQASSADILTTALVRAESKQLPTVMHVHDEILLDVLLGQTDYYIEKLEEVMLRPIPWLTDFPLSVGGWVGDRYKKD